VIATPAWVRRGIIAHNLSSRFSAALAASFNKAMHVDGLFRGAFANLALPNFIAKSPLHNPQVIAALKNWAFISCRVW